MNLSNMLLSDSVKQAGGLRSFAHSVCPGLSVWSYRFPAVGRKQFFCCRVKQQNTLPFMLVPLFYCVSLLHTVLFFANGRLVSLAEIALWLSIYGCTSHLRPTSPII